MGWKDFFKKKKNNTPEPVIELALANLQVGYFVDYDLKTWEVTAYNYYDWGANDITYEWQLKSHDDTIYLEREPDDEDYWSISRTISLSSLGPEIKEYIIEHEDPPDQIAYNGIDFYLDETCGGNFYKDGNKLKKELLKWDYCDDSGKKLLIIEQWGERNFEASAGCQVEEYQFTNILPGNIGKD